MCTVHMSFNKSIKVNCNQSIDRTRANLLDIFQMSNVHKISKCSLVVWH